jgi:RND family efflux transporter MFP subunit
VTLNGTLEAQESISLAFRVGGQLVERRVNVGDRVRAGQLVARLDAESARHSVDAARASVAAAMARLVEARNTIDRYEPLLARGFVARAQFDRAVETRDAAQAQVDAAEAQLRTAESQLAYRDLVADGPGTVTARGAEPGEVVAAGRMIVQLARQGGRDAVLDVPPRVKDALPLDSSIEVVSATDPGVRASGRIREVSPQADPMTRTFRVRVGLDNPPETMRLGSSVTGTLHIGGESGIAIPASALGSAQGQPAVWVVDPKTQTVSQRSVDVIAHELDRVLLAHGLADGELVVTAGVQSLRPNQQVRLLGGGPGAQGSAAAPAPTDASEPAAKPGAPQ